VPRHPQILAHRGARRAAPENTLPAFARALEMGADGIELDVHRSRDGRLVVIHDFTLEHTTNGIGPVADLTAAELAALDAGNHFAPEFAGTPVPTLDEVFDLVGERARVNVEIKSESWTGGDAIEPLVAMIQARNLYDQVIVSSFNPITLVKLRHADPKIAIGLLLEEDLPPHLRFAWFTPILQPQALHPAFGMVDAAFMAWARGRGCVVNVWTVNDAGEARRLIALGVDALITDVPDVLIAALF
jgi:glycerophosphoryl diester phosphodiesterase